MAAPQRSAVEHELVSKIQKVTSRNQKRRFSKSLLKNKHLARVPRTSDQKIEK